MKSSRPSWLAEISPVEQVNGLLEPAPPAVRPDNERQEDEEDD